MPQWCAPGQKSPGPRTNSVALAVEQCKKIIYKALENKTNILAALWACKPVLASVNVDKTLAKPKVSIIGEFWAMTTEGDGNYQLQRFLESEGAEARSEERRGGK